MKNGKLKVAHVSDVHLGHRKVPVARITKGLRYTLNEELVSTLDMIIIAGDLFDRGLTMPVDDVPEIILWSNHILRMCAKHNVKLRIVEGTSYHDRKQSKYLVTLNELLDNKADIRYYENLCIDHEDDLGIDILYVPDEWKNSTEKAWEDVTKELKKHGLDKVDYSIMHGMFEYQLPKGVKLPHHREERYLGITRHYVSIGHFHRMSSYKRIFAQGSHDRLTHNEEEPKGLIVSEIFDDPSKDKTTFIENVHAMPFLTINVKDMEEKEASKKIDEFVINLLDNGIRDCYLRVEMNDNKIMRTLFTNFVKGYDMFSWKSKIIKTKDKKSKEERKARLKKVTSIDSKTISDLVLEKASNLGKDGTGVVKELSSIIGELNGS